MVTPDKAEGGGEGWRVEFRKLQYKKDHNLDWTRLPSPSLGRSWLFEIWEWRNSSAVWMQINNP